MIMAFAEALSKHCATCFEVRLCLSIVLIVKQNCLTSLLDLAQSVGAQFRMFLWHIYEHDLYAYASHVVAAHSC
jgi:hypothetical protein